MTSIDPIRDLLDEIKTEVDASHFGAAVSPTVALLQLLAAAGLNPNDDWYRERAREDYHIEGEVEIEDIPVVSASDEGAYVQAWVWVDKRDSDQDAEGQSDDIASN